MHGSLPTLSGATQRVVIGSLEHYLPILIGLVLGIVAIFYATKHLNVKGQYRFINVIAMAISLTVISFHLHKMIFSEYNIQKDLPLYLCSLLAIILPVFTMYRKFWMFEILVFWIIAGTLQAVITLDIASGFPTFDYVRYWVVHLGLLLVISYAIVVYKMIPNFRSVFKSFFALQLYVLAIVFINYLLNANYFYLNQKPQSASLLNYLGEWPVYVIVVQLILVPYFLLIYLPFYVYKLMRKRQNQQE